MDMLNQSFFFYVRQDLLIEFFLLLLDDLLFLLGLGLLDHDIERILFFVIDLEFLLRIKEIIPNEFGDIRKKSQFRNLEKRNYDKDDEYKDCQEYSDDFGS